MSSSAPVLNGIFRLGAGLLFMQHGLQKLFGLLGGLRLNRISHKWGSPGYWSFFGGLLVILRFQTRPVSLILALEMVIAYFIAHQPQGSFPIRTGQS